MRPFDLNPIWAKANGQWKMGDEPLLAAIISSCQHGLWWPCGDADVTDRQ